MVKFLGNSVFLFRKEYIVIIIYFLCIIVCFLGFIWMGIFFVYVLRFGVYFRVESGF